MLVENIMDPNAITIPPTSSEGKLLNILQKKSDRYLQIRITGDRLMWPNNISGLKL